jgi:pimeloyl-ACP methyl ester carboxylesterase
VAKGHRVLTYDLYGRGYSDRPGGEQDARFFIRQLEDLLEHQGVTQPVTLLGYSMGGAIGAAFAAKHPRPAAPPRAPRTCGLRP